jgi:hypothetical protein
MEVSSRSTQLCVNAVGWVRYYFAVLALRDVNARLVLWKFQTSAAGRRTKRCAACLLVNVRVVVELFKYRLCAGLFVCIRGHIWPLVLFRESPSLLLFQLDCHGLMAGRLRKIVGRRIWTSFPRFGRNCFRHLVTVTGHCVLVGRFGGL